MKEEMRRYYATRQCFTPERGRVFYEDGRMDWDFSTDGRFEEVQG